MTLAHSSPVDGTTLNPAPIYKSATLNWPYLLDLIPLDQLVLSMTCARGFHGPFMPFIALACNSASLPSTQYSLKKWGALGATPRYSSRSGLTVTHIAQVTPVERAGSIPIQRGQCPGMSNVGITLKSGISLLAVASIVANTQRRC